MLNDIAFSWTKSGDSRPDWSVWLRSLTERNGRLRFLIDWTSLWMRWIMLMFSDHSSGAGICVNCWLNWLASLCRPSIKSLVFLLYSIWVFLESSNAAAANAESLGLLFSLLSLLQIWCASSYWLKWARREAFSNKIRLVWSPLFIELLTWLNAFLCLPCWINFFISSMMMRSDSILIESALSFDCLFDFRVDFLLSKIDRCLFNC